LIVFQHTVDKAIPGNSSITRLYEEPANSRIQSHFRKISPTSTDISNENKSWTKI